MGRERDNESIEDLPSDDRRIDTEGEANREQMDQPPPPGTDPMNEGP